MATLEQALSLVSTLEAELSQRSGEADTYLDYYRGKQPLRFASEEFRKYHGKRYAGFSDNWVQVVADSPVERLTVQGIKPAQMDQADAESWRVWQANGLDADSQLGFQGAVIAARSFVLVWGDPDDDETPVVTFEDATSCVVLYEPGSRRKRRAALRRWQDGYNDVAVLYLPDEVWKFQRPTAGRQDDSPQERTAAEDMKSWQPMDREDEPNPQPNPMGVVPIVELPNRPLLAADPVSDVKGVVAMQDAINLLWAQLFTASDYASFPQRIVLGAERPTTPVLDDQGQIVGERPVDLEKFAVDRVLWITGEDAKVAEWQAANLTAYTEVMEVAVGHVAAQTRTPQHYLIGKMANLSGDALIAAETGLVKRVEEKQLWYGQALREMFRLIALAQDNTAKAKAISGGHVLWADAESRSRNQLADAMLKLKQVGFPFEYLASHYGLTPTQVTEVLSMRERDMERMLLDPSVLEGIKGVDSDGAGESADSSGSAGEAGEVDS